ncbi:MAG TPA: glycosyl hydrolase family 28-related protein [Bryobacteraceae bacterium]|jgi:polygalacturonase|nr:glycosyl hydrolase family 28-related protein [Bryobacteraceae bacterium]
MKIVKFALCFCVLASAHAAAEPGSPVFYITNYGAVGDGNTLDSAAINKAIDAANSAGGGTVYFPPGTWLSGSIHLKSNVALYLEQGSTILATSDPRAYDAAEPNSGTSTRTSVTAIFTTV